MLSGFLLARNVFELSVESARTGATTVLVLVGLYLVLVLEMDADRRRSRFVYALVAAMLVVYVLVLALGGTRDFFELAAPGLRILVASVVGTALAVGFLWCTSERFWPFERGAPRPEG